MHNIKHGAYVLLALRIMYLLTRNKHTVQKLLQCIHTDICEIKFEVNTHYYKTLLMLGFIHFEDVMLKCGGTTPVVVMLGNI